MVEAEQRVQIKNIMIAANANTIFKAMDYNQEVRLVAYAANNSLLILDPHHVTQREEDGATPLLTPKVLFGLGGHTTRINAVQWLSSDLIVTIGGDEKVVIVWEKVQGMDARNPEAWREGWKTKNAHSATINYLTVLKGETQTFYFTTMCS